MGDRGCVVVLAKCGLMPSPRPSPTGRGRKHQKRQRGCRFAFTLRAAYSRADSCSGNRHTQPLGDRPSAAPARRTQA
ncbi:hypothetical protein DN555_21740 [Enterobacter asburiae]|nr:hypothetical protein C3394_05390 [Enterobacter cloacae complex sp. ECNIH11]POV46339.1 hypothetical protein C3397_05300 [Enterobacter cloacae complex sp. ECNIH16]RWT09813.1 hypothetical protein DN555_21740 [Enterobacter asburiae]